MKRMVAVITCLIAGFIPAALTGAQSVASYDINKVVGLAKKNTDLNALSSACSMAGGQMSLLRECDGSESAWCEISATERCYADSLRDGHCDGPVSAPRVFCDQQP